MSGVAETVQNDRAILDAALPHQVAVDLSYGTGDNGLLRRLYCTNLNIGPGHESAIVRDITSFIFCFADLRDANRFRSQFGGKLLSAGRKAATSSRDHCRLGVRASPSAVLQHDQLGAGRTIDDFNHVALGLALGVTRSFAGG